MKHSIVVFGVCLALLFLYKTKSGDIPGEVVRGEDQVAQASAHAEVIELADPDELVGARESVEVGPGEPAIENEPMCVVRGRLVTPEGEPLAGLSLLFKRVGGEMEWTCESGAAGRFEQEIPWQAGAREYLLIQPSERTQRFRDVLPSMDPGVVELGDLVCLTGSSIRGRVTDLAGNAISEAKVMSLAGNRYTQAKTDEEGNYIILGVLPGSNQVSASCPKYMHEGPREWNVRIGEPAGGVDFVLQASLTLDGIVVDAEGVGVAHASVEVSPEVGPSNRGSSRVKTDAGGFFRAYPTLPGEQGVTVLHADYLPRDSFGSATYLPGDPDVRITIQLGEKHTFRVVDKALGTPLEDCSILIMPRAANGGRPNWEGRNLYHRANHYPGGELSIRAAGGKDAVEVQAAGYQTLRVNVAALEKGTQVLRLKAGWIATGRVVLKGQAVEGARVVLTTKGSAAKRTLTDAEGRFEVAGLAAPSYKVLASQSGVTSERLEVTEKRPDAGDLVLQALGEVLGTLLIPDFIEPGEINLSMGSFRQIPIDAEGRFHMKDVPAGKHVLGVRSIDGKLDGFVRGFAHGEPSVELNPGQVAEVTLDLNEFSVGSIRLRLLADGLPVVDYPVSLGRRLGEVSTSRSLGRTDRDGWALGSFAPGTYQFATSGGAMDLNGWTIDCVAGQRTEAVLDLPTGKLSIQLPPEWTLPGTGIVQVKLVDAQQRASDLFAMGRRAYLKDGQRFQGLGSFPAMTLDLERRRIECISMPVGTFEVQVQLFDGKIVTNGEVLFGGGPGVGFTGGEQLHSASKRLTVEASAGPTIWEISAP